MIRERGESPSSSSNSLEGLWKQIWKLKVPHKIRSFMWRILSNALPTMTNLFRRGCSNTNRCLICTGQTENMSHLFCFCPWAHKCWFGSSFCFSLDNEGNFDFTQWLQHCFLKLQLTEWEKALLATTLWLIWKGRNAFVYDHRSTDSIFTIKHAGDLVAEYWEANGLFTDSSYPVELSNNPETMVKWKKPIPGELKFNIDAAFDEQKEEAAIAFLVRDEQGWMLDGDAKIIKAHSALEAKCHAMDAAIKFATENDLENVTFESNNQQLINMLTMQNIIPDWRCDSILDHIFTSGSLLRNHQFLWIPRKANETADWISKAVLKRSCPQDWSTRPPPQLELLLVRDMDDTDFDGGG